MKNIVSFERPSGIVIYIFILELGKSQMIRFEKYYEILTHSMLN